MDIDWHHVGSSFLTVAVLSAPILLVLAVCWWCDMPSGKDMPGRWWDA